METGSETLNVVVSSRHSEIDQLRDLWLHPHSRHNCSVLPSEPSYPHDSWISDTLW